MRPILAVVLCVVILGGTWSYIQFLGTLSVGRNIVEEVDSESSYTLEITSTFNAASDDFQQSGLVIEFRGKILYESDELAAGVTRRIENVEGVKLGLNDFFVAVCPAEQVSNVASEFSLDNPNTETQPVNQSAIARAIQVKILEGETVLSSETVWSSAPGVVSALVSLNVVEQPAQHSSH